MTSFDPQLLLQTLHRHGVAYIIVGGFAGNMLGTDRVTGDLDICYRRDDPNLKALVLALRNLDASLRGAPAGLPFILDERTLKNGDCFTFITRGGSLDCLGTPAGTNGYDDLVRSSWVFDLEGTEVRVCSLDDLIRMKKAARRAKDETDIEQLTALKKLIAGNS